MIVEQVEIEEARYAVVSRSDEYDDWAVDWLVYELADARRLRDEIADSDWAKKQSEPEVKIVELGSVID